MSVIKWLFFDMGSTLVDETKCTDLRIADTLKQRGAPNREEFYKRMEYFSSINKLPYKDAVKYYGLTKIKWPKQLEELYPEVTTILQLLQQKYNLGIIANQSIGTEERLERWNIDKYFNLVVASAEAGLEKPDIRIFELALSKADCLAEEACMIGDRLDNDIDPAAHVGMHTVWVRQGWFGKGNIDLIQNKPEYVIDEINEILNLFLYRNIENTLI